MLNLCPNICHPCFFAQIFKFVFNRIKSYFSGTVIPDDPMDTSKSNDGYLHISKTTNLLKFTYLFLRMYSWSMMIMSAELCTPVYM